MALSPLLRWGSIISVIVAAVLAYSFQQPLFLFSAFGDPLPVYCYKSVRTHDSKQPSAECFSVQDGHFVGVWARDSKDSPHGIKEADVSISDGHVIPGLWDGHGHLLQYGEFLHSVDLFGSQSLDDVKDRIKTYLAANPEAGTKDHWLRGVGWDQTVFGRMPTADDIEQDEQLKGIFMMLDRIDVHCSWVSKAVLDLLPDQIPDVPGGEIVRDPGPGVFCDNAMDMIMDLWPKPGVEEKTRAVKTAMKELNKVGIVGMHDAGVTAENARLYADLAFSDDWTVRVYSMLECPKRNTFCPENAPQIEHRDAKFVLRSVKLFADGALGSWGSAMLEPYSDHPWTSGSLLINASALTEVTKLWAREGFQVNIHAIGDLANRNAIDAFEAALVQQCRAKKGNAKALAECQSKHRFRIEHSQIIHPTDQKRMHAMGIIPSIQPTHATSDMKYAEQRLGPQRTSKEAYRMKSLLDINPVLGSDFPVEPPNPFQGIYAAVTRKNPHTGLGPDPEKPSEGWHMEEALSLDEALIGFTRNVAYGAFREYDAGKIDQGTLADWVVLDEPLEDMDIEKLRTLKVRETWVGGRRVYSRDEQAWPLSDPM